MGANNQLKIEFYFEIENNEFLLNDLRNKMQKNQKLYEELKELVNKKLVNNQFQINIFWANPYYTKDMLSNMVNKNTNENKNLNDQQTIKARLCNTTIRKNNDLKKQQLEIPSVSLYNSVKYTYYIEGIIKQLKNSNKMINLIIDNFNRNCLLSNKLTNKNKLSVVYAIVQTQFLQLAKKNQKQYFLSNNRKMSQIQNLCQSQEQEQMRKIQQLTHTTSLQIPLNIQFNKTQSISENDLQSNTSQEVSIEANNSLFIQYKGQNHHSNYKTNKYSEQQDKNLLKFIIGQNNKGESSLISNKNLQQMLKGKQIQLLIFHTNYNEYHKKILSKYCKNILYINSNPLQTDQSTKQFIRTFFKQLMVQKNISNAYNKALNQIKMKYQSLQCCCYHAHKKDCKFTKLKQNGMFQKYHYNYHVYNCSCQNKQMLLHKLQCQDRKYSTLKYQQLKKKNTTQKFECCCQRNQLHSIKQKFKLQELSQINQDFSIVDGQLNKNQTQWMNSFFYHDQVIGNSNLIEQIVKYFMVTDQKNIKIKLYNLYGVNSNGKQYISKFVANLLIRKNYGKYKRCQIIYFNSKLQINLSKITDKINSTIFIFINRQNQNQNCQYFMKYSLLQNIKGIIVTTKRIKSENINKKKIKMMSGTHQPFNYQQCIEFISYKTNFNIAMKNKLKAYIQSTVSSDNLPDNLTLKSILYKNKNKSINQSKIKSKPLEDKVTTFYYPSTFEIQQIKYILKKTLKCTITHQYNIITEANKANKLKSMIVIGGGLQNCNRQEERHLSQKLLKLSIKTSSKQLADYYLIIFKKYYKKIKPIPLLKQFIQYTILNDNQLRFYQATTINSKSYISTLMKTMNILADKKDQCIEQQQQIDYNELFNNQIQTNIKSGLHYLTNCLLKHTIFIHLSQKQKLQFLLLGTILINNAIIYLKNMDYRQKQKINRLSLSLLLLSKSFSSIYQYQQSINFTSKLESIKLFSIEGLKYLLQRIYNHLLSLKNQDFEWGNIKIVIITLLFQLNLQDMYNSQNFVKVNELLSKKYLQQIMKLIYFMDTGYLEDAFKSLKFELRTYKILQLTNCGRQSLKKQHYKQINNILRINYSHSSHPEQHNMKGSYFTLKAKGLQKDQIEGRSQIVFKICDNKRKYYQITQNLRYVSKEQGSINQLIQYYGSLIDYMKLINKCQPLNNPSYCYRTLTKLKQQLIVFQKHKIQNKKISYYIRYLFEQLKFKLRHKLQQLNKKLFFWMQSYPHFISDKAIYSPYRQIIKNQQLDKFDQHQKNQQLSRFQQDGGMYSRSIYFRKCRFMQKNFKLLKQIQGCRFICFRVDIDPKNQKMLISQDDKSLMKNMPIEDFITLLSQIPFINIFLCIPFRNGKHKQFLQKLSQKIYYQPQIIYFNFDSFVIEQDNKNRNATTIQLMQLQIMYQRMIMTQITRFITYYMHFQKYEIYEAYQKAINTLQFIDDNNNCILQSSKLNQVVNIKNYNAKNSKLLHQQLKKCIQLKKENSFTNKDLQKIYIILKDIDIRQQKQQLSLQGQDVNPQIIINKDKQYNIIIQDLNKFVNGLIEYLKLKKRYMQYKKVDLSQIDSEINLFQLMKEKKIFDFYKTIKSGFIIFIHTELISGLKQWEKKQFQRLFNLNNSNIVNSIKVKVQQKQSKYRTEIIICFINGS